jgi:hypothetical protein
MNITINRNDRDAIYDGLMTDLTAIGDIFSHLHNDEPTHARRLRRRFEVELRLLDDLGWEKEPESERCELTLPARELRPVIERIYSPRCAPRPRPSARPRTRRRDARNAGYGRPSRRRRPTRSRHRQRRARASQGSARNPHRRPAHQQPGGNPTHLPRRRTRGLRAEQFSGRCGYRTHPRNHPESTSINRLWRPRHCTFLHRIVLNSGDALKDTPTSRSTATRVVATAAARVAATRALHHASALATGRAEVKTL